MRQWAKLPLVSARLFFGSRGVPMGISRRVGQAIRLAIALAVLGSLLSLRGQSSAIAQVSDLRIVDVHGHIQAKASAEELIRLMDQTGVSRIVLMPTYGPERGTDEQALSYAKRFPGRFIPFVGFQNQRPLAVDENWFNPDEAALRFLSSVEAKLRGGGFFGLGEVMLRYYGHPGEPADCCPEVDHPADSPLMFRIVELATRFQLPVNIHAEAEPKVAAAMERLLKAFPGSTLIWSHNCGRQSAEAIRKLLASYANLYCDLGSMTNARPGGGYGAGWPRTMPWTFLVDDVRGQLLPEMKSLFEQFPDRFMVGIDAYFYSAYVNYPIRVTRFRQQLSQLAPATARKIAYENAERVLRLPPVTR